MPMTEQIKKAKPYIICAAVYFKNGKKYVHQPINIKSGIVICGRMHHNIFPIMGMMFDRLEYLKNHETGFLTSDNRYVGREEAREIALAAGQITETRDPKDLYSEDLY